MALFIFLFLFVCNYVSFTFFGNKVQVQMYAHTCDGMRSGIRRWALALLLRHAKPQTRPSPYGPERRISPNADAHICLDIEAGCTGTAVQTREGAGVPLDFGYLAVTERASQHACAQGGMQLKIEASATNTTHKSGPQEDRAMQQGQQAAKAARPGAAPTHTGATPRPRGFGCRIRTEPASEPNPMMNIYLGALPGPLAS